MDNDAFTSLVRERAHVKNTKQIAREAVEAEFKKRGKGRKRAYSSGSDNDDINEGDKRRRRQHTAKDSVRARHKNSNDDDSDDIDVTKKQEYRDRAKERREGKNDSLNRDSFTAAIAPTAVMHKNKIRSSGSASTKKANGASDVVMLTREEARLFLQRKLEGTRQLEFHSSSPGLPAKNKSHLMSNALNLISNRFSPTELPPGATLLSHQKNQLKSSTAKALQRSRLVMNPKAFRKAAWQKPNEVAGDPNPNYERNRYCGGGQLIDLKIATGIEKAVQNQRSSTRKSATPSPTTKKGNESELDGFVCHEQNQKTANFLAPVASATVESDDEEDIFGRIGV